MKRRHQAIWCDAPMGDTLLFALQEKNGRRYVLGRLQEEESQYYLHKCAVTAILEPALTSGRLLTLPAGQPRDTARMVAMELLAGTGFSGQYGFDYQVVERHGHEQQVFAFYAALESLQQLAKPGIKLKRAATVYDGLLALQRQSKRAADGYGGLLYWEGERLFLLALRGDKPLYAQMLTGISSAEKAAEEYWRTVNALIRQNDWPVEDWRIDALLAADAGDGQLKAQLAGYLGQMVSWLDEGYTESFWPLGNRYLAAKALLEEG